MENVLLLFFFLDNISYRKDLKYSRYDERKLAKYDLSYPLIFFEGGNLEARVT